MGRISAVSGAYRGRDRDQLGVVKPLGVPGCIGGTPGVCGGYPKVVSFCTDDFERLL